MDYINIFGHEVYGGAVYGIAVVASLCLVFIVCMINERRETNAMYRNERVRRHKEARRK